MSIQPDWLEIIPGEDFKGAVKFLNSLDWNISISSSDNRSKVFAGSQLLFSSSNEKEVESFIFGMALGLAVLPEEVLDLIRKIIGV
jgi:hypothetical protein